MNADRPDEGGSREPPAAGYTAAWGSSVSAARASAANTAGAAAPLSVPDQIEQGRLVCPLTRARLRWIADGLATEDGSRSYRVASGVPILLEDAAAAAAYANEGADMVAEYAPEKHAWTLWSRLVRGAKAVLSRDYRTLDSRRAFARVFEALPDGAVALAVGGGPQRAHPSHTNLNIGLFPNVDVVGDAHRLPYADEGVDAVYCEAVLEHLVDPRRAVREMYRALRPEGMVFAATPFMQPYHGYPHHYQNFTLTGHRRLFEDCGFSVEEAGTCVGPTFTLVDVAQKFVGVYGPKGLRYPASLLVRTLGMLVKPADVYFREHKESHVLASTTYLVARHPGR